MKAFLDGIRTPKKGGSFTKQFLITVAILAFGFALGVLQKWMDEFAGSVFPPILLQLDLGNFFGRLGIWIVLGTALSVYAPSPLGASLRTAGFFLSMVAGYYLYCNYGLGFIADRYDYGRRALSTNAGYSGANQSARHNFCRYYYWCNGGNYGRCNGYLVLLAGNSSQFTGNYCPRINSIRV